MINIFKKHFLVILLSVIVGALTAAPEFFVRREMGDKYQGIYHIVSGDEPYYLTRAQEIKDGHSFLANTYLAEHKDNAPSQFWLPDYLMAKPLAWFNAGVVKGYVFYDFLYPAILVILTYIVFFLLTKSVFIGLTGASFLHLGFFLEEFNRSPSPQFIFIFWLLLFILLLKYLERPKNIFLILGSVNLGLLFYLYPYYWMFYLTFIGVFIILNLLRDRQFNFLPYLYLAGGALIIGLPYFISVYNNLRNTIYGESLARIGMIETHFPSGIKIVFLSLAIIILTWAFYKKKLITLNLTVIFLLSANIAVALATNQHIVTGKNLEFSSHFLMISEFCFVFLAVYLIQALSEFFKIKCTLLIKVFIILAVVLISWFNSYHVLVRQTRLSAQDYYQQNYAPIFDWLNRNTEKDQVVFANREISGLIPIYTSDNIFYCGPIVLSSMANQEIWQRFIINNYWETFDEKFIKKNERGFFGTKYISAYNHNLSKNKLRRVFGLGPAAYENIPADQINNILSLAESIKREPFSDLIKRYQVDYLIWDKNIDKKWGVKDQNFLIPIFEANNIIVYKLAKN